MKACTACGILKPLEGFHRHPRAPLGRACKCKPCAKVVAQKSYARHKEAHQVRMAKWRDENRESLLEGKKRYYQENRERWYTTEAKTRQRQWNAENRERNQARERNRYAVDVRYQLANVEKASRRRTSVPPWVKRADVAPFYAEARRLTRETGYQWQVDHFIPIKHPLVSGLHVPANLRVIPGFENASKKNRFEIA